MSELQAVFQARRRRAEQGTAAPTTEGIEFSPGAVGREELDLGAKGAPQASLGGKGGTAIESGKGDAPTDPGGAKMALRKSNKFGVRHSNPPGTLYPDEPSDEEIEEAGGGDGGNAPPKNELQRKLEARRLKANTGAGTKRPEADDGAATGGGPRTPKSPKVEMKWNSQSMVYEAVLSPSSTAAIADANSAADAPRASAESAGRTSPTKGPTSFFKRTFPTANSGTTVSYGPRATPVQSSRRSQIDGDPTLNRSAEADEGTQEEQPRTQPNDQPGGAMRQIGGRPPQSRDFSRTVGGRSRSTRSDISGSSDNQPSGMLSAMARRYVDDRKEAEQQQQRSTEEPPLETMMAEGEGGIGQETRSTPTVKSNAPSDASGSGVPEFMRMRAGLKKRSAGAVASGAAEAPPDVKADEQNEEQKDEEAARSNPIPPQSQETTKSRGRVWPPVSSAAPSSSYKAAFPTVTNAAVEANSPSRPETKAEIEEDEPAQKQIGDVRGRWQPPGARMASEPKVSTHGGYPFRHESARGVGGVVNEEAAAPNSSPDKAPGQKLQPWQKELKASRPSHQVGLDETAREGAEQMEGTVMKDTSTSGEEPRHDETDPKTEVPQQRGVSTYDTAVMAARDAINMSNQSRRSKETLDPPAEEVSMVRDPSLLMESSLEPSPDSSLVDEKVADGVAEGDRLAQLAAFVGDDVPPTPTFATAGTPSRSPPEGFFTDSFVNGTEGAGGDSSPQQTAESPEKNATPPQQPRESLGEPAFGSSDPFDPFNTTKESTGPLEDSKLFQSTFPEVVVEAPKSDATGQAAKRSPPAALAGPDLSQQIEKEQVTARSQIPAQEKKFDAADDTEDALIVPEAMGASTEPERAMMHWQPPREANVAAQATFDVRPFRLSLYASPKDSGRIAAPVANPSSGNLIACLHPQNGEFVIEELLGAAAGGRPVTVVSARVQQEELAEKLQGIGINAKVLGISSILSLSAGIHRVRGRGRVRVAALMELYVAGNDNSGGCLKKMRIVGVWRWGYSQPRAPSGIARASFQSVLTLLDVEADGYFDPKTMQVADGLLFLGGHLNGRNVDSREAASTAAVFVAKPSVKDGWLAMPAGSGAKAAVALAVSQKDAPHIAVGLSDGTVSVYSYDRVARTNRNVQRNQASPSAMLQLVCRIDCESDLGSLAEDACLWPNGENFSSAEAGSHHQNMSLEWINNASSSGASVLPLLACASSSGLSVYHVQPDHLNQQQQPETIPTTKPLAMTMYSKVTATRKSLLAPKVGWLDMGPRRPPALALLLMEQGGRRAMLCLCAIDIPWYGGMEPSSRHRSIGNICQMKVDVCGGPSLVASPRGSGIALWSGEQLLLCEATTNAKGVLHSPVSSPPLGLDSFGCAYQGNPSANENHADSILSVFSVTACEDIDGSSSIPTQRHWLMTSTVEETGRVTSVPLFELTCGESPTSELIPERVIKEAQGSRAAVVFSAGFFGGGTSSSRTRIRSNPVAYAILDITAGLGNRGSSSFELRRGRDVAFLPPKVTPASEGGFYCSSLVVLDDDGASLSITTLITSSVLPEGENERVVESIQKCSLQYEGIEGRRVFSLLSGEKPDILLYGFSKVVRRSCLLLSRHRLERDSISNQLTLIESTELGHRLWLDEGEEILSLIELPLQDQAKRANIAIASQQRVMIISVASSGALTIVAEVGAHLTCGSLIPLGSHCVAFSAETSGSSGSSCLMYLSCLAEVERGSNHGSIATLPTKARDTVLPLAMFPDRCVYLNKHSALKTIASRDGESNDEDHSFEFPQSHTHPLLLLEPLVANALCGDGRGGRDAASNADVQSTLLSIIEKFGRKYHAFPYSDEHPGGIGTNGAGVTSRVYDLLVGHGCDVAALVLLTGNVPSDGSASEPKILPPWIPMESKLSAASMNFKAGAMSQVLSRGSTQPGPHDVAKILAREMALKTGNRFSEENLLSRLAALTGKDDESPTKLAAMLTQLAPSVQCAWEDDNMADTTKALEAEGKSPGQSNDNEMYWAQSFGKNKHVWDTGPLGNQESLLSLDDFDSWLGTCQPSALGKEGIEAAADTGEGALADILHAATAGDGTAGNGVGNGTSDVDGRHKNWVAGIGEAPDDEDNLSLYLRFSEGEQDEDSDWATEGFADLTKHGHRARLYGPDYTSVEATTSSVDEGEEGKVHLLYDLVFRDGAPRSQATGIVVEAPRGGSLDVGMLHDPQSVSSRGKCTVELWYHLPQSHVMTHEIILARRALFYEEGDDASNLCLPDEKHNVLWELAVLPTGKLELRTGAGSIVSTVDDLVFWEREDGLGGWNHVCVLFSQSASSPTQFSASILANGAAVASNASLTVNPFGSDPAVQELNQEDIEDAMERTIFIFGIGPSLGFRLTDVRVWACSRSEEDIAMMMYEYLRAAEMRKKFRVKIQQKEGDKKTKSVGKLLPPPGSKKTLALAPPPRQSHPKRDAAPHENDANEPVADFDAFAPDFSAFANDQFGEGAEGEPTMNVPDNVDFAGEPLSVDSEEDLAAESDPRSVPREATSSNEALATGHVQDPGNDQLWDDYHLAKAGALAIPPVVEEQPMLSPSDSDGLEEVVEAPNSSFDVNFSDLLSSQVRASAAAAIVRGPPATRHFGGNRGGLFSASSGVSPIAICGSDKSVVWFSDRDPPARTFPLGASGAVLSDVMDASGSEYMCCFLAKEKRIVVFELNRKTVVVELQMKTKLNFWRYLPGEAHGGDLAFVLITPVGGFHWKPLDESPRPVQVWRRGAELESKKILAYEEGGSNGKIGGNARSTVALVIASPTTPRSTVEAYCMALDGGSGAFCVSNLVLGAALCCPASSAAAMPAYFLPFIVTISMDVTSQLVLDVEDLQNDEDSGAIVRGNILASTVLDHLGPAEAGEFFEPPSMSMGASPEALCCCHGGFIAVIVRSRGLVYAYDFSSNEDLVLVGKTTLGQYIVDAAIRSSGVKDRAELVLLLCEGDDAKDGRVVTVNISRGDGIHSEFLSSI
ncbi:hypothetical protein ACHAXT_005050 [Thalassiosira profunda]